MVLESPIFQCFHLCARYMPPSRNLCELPITQEADQWSIDVWWAIPPSCIDLIQVNDPQLYQDLPLCPKFIKDCLTSSPFSNDSTSPVSDKYNMSYRLMGPLMISLGFQVSGYFFHLSPMGSLWQIFPQIHEIEIPFNQWQVHGEKIT